VSLDIMYALFEEDKNRTNIDFEWCDIHLKQYEELIKHFPELLYYSLDEYDLFTDVRSN